MREVRDPFWKMHPNMVAAESARVIYADENDYSDYYGNDYSDYLDDSEKICSAGYADEEEEDE